ncbi:hypothetical protein ACOME3_006459 [Neoechinorhynchus agilis]
MNSRGEETNGRKGKRLNQRLRKQRRVRFSKLSSQKQQSLQTQLMKATKLTRKNAQRDRDYLNFLNVSNKRKYRELLSRKEFAIADELCSDAREILRKYNIFLTSSFLEAKFLSERWKDVLKAESGALDDVFDAVSKIILEDEGYVMGDLELTKKIDEQFLKFMDQLEDHQRKSHLKKRSENVQEWNMPRIEKSKDTHKSVGKRDTNMHYGTDLKSQFDDIYTDTMKINISNDEDNYHIDRFAKLHESSKAHFLLNLLQKTEDATVELMNAMRQMIGSDDLTMNMSVAK